MLLEIWLANQAKFRAIVRTFFLDHSLVEDVLQEAFTRILQGKPDFGSEMEATNYLRRSVINTTIDKYRKHRRRAQFLNRHNTRIQLREASEETSPEGPLNRLLENEESLTNQQLRNAVSRAMKDLPPKQRDAIEAFFHGTRGNMKEFCNEAGVPYSTLRSRMLSGIDKIRESLRKNGVPGFDNHSGEE